MTTLPRTKLYQSTKVIKHTHIHRHRYEKKKKMVKGGGPGGQCGSPPCQQRSGTVAGRSHQSRRPERRGDSRESISVHNEEWGGEDRGRRRRSARRGRDDRQAGQGNTAHAATGTGSHGRRGGGRRTNTIHPRTGCQAYTRYSH